VAALLAMVAAAGSASVYRQNNPLPAGGVYGQGLGAQVVRETTAGELDTLRAAGVRWVRFDLRWESIEGVRGTYNFSRVDGIINNLQSRGMRAIFTLQGVNPHYAGGNLASPEAVTGFANFAAACVDRYRERGHIWEIWNEPNHPHFWPPQPNVEDYIVMARAATIRMRAVSPDEWIGGPGTFIDIPFLTRCFQAGLLDHWDFVTVHPYTRLAPEVLIEQEERLRQLIDRYSRKTTKIPVIASEVGYSERYQGLNRELQGKYIPRVYLLNKFLGIDTVLLYQWRDAGPDPMHQEHTFGLVHFDLTPKRAYRALHLLSQQLAGFRFHSRLQTGNPENYVLLFTNGVTEKIVIYTGLGNRQISVPVTPGTFDVVNEFGTTTVTTATNLATFNATDEFLVATPRLPNVHLRLMAGQGRLPAFDTINTRNEARDLVAPLFHSFAALTNLAGTMRIVDVSTDPSNPIRLDQTWTVAEIRAISNLSAWIENLATTLPINRDHSAAYRRFTVEVALPGFAPFRQTMTVMKARPVAMEVLPPLGDHMQVLVQSPLGATLDGRVRARFSDGVVVERPVTFAEGETEKIVFMNVNRARMALGFTLELFNNAVQGSDDARRMIQTQPQALVWFENFAGQPLNTQPGLPNYRFLIEGDPSVTGGANSFITTAPPGLPLPNQHPLRIDYGFSSGGRVLNIVPSTDRSPFFSNAPLSMGVWVHGDDSKAVLLMRMRDSTGQFFQWDHIEVNWTGWRFVKWNLQEKYKFWSGANNGVMNFPVRVSSPLIVTTHGPGGSGSIQVTGFTVLGAR
jgi:polysaccharide biosynthesis protein PslG